MSASCSRSVEKKTSGMVFLENELCSNGAPPWGISVLAS